MISGKVGMSTEQKRIYYVISSLHSIPSLLQHVKAMNSILRSRVITVETLLEGAVV